MKEKPEVKTISRSPFGKTEGEEGTEMAQKMGQ